MQMEVGTAIGILGTLAAIIFGYAAFTRGRRADNQADGKQIGNVLTELGYIKSGVDDVKSAQKEAAQQYVGVVDRLAKVESSAQQAHHRIDRLERKDNND